MMSRYAVSVDHQAVRFLANSQTIEARISINKTPDIDAMPNRIYSR